MRPEKYIKNEITNKGRMSQKDFNRSLGDYLSTRRKKENPIDIAGNVKRIFNRTPKKSVKEEYPELSDTEVQVIPSEKPFHHKVIHHIKKVFVRKAPEAEEAMEDEDEMLEEPVIEETHDFESEEQEIQEEIRASPSLMERIFSFFGRMKADSSVDYESSISYEVDGESELKQQLDDLDRREEELNVEKEELKDKRKSVMERLFGMFEEKAKVQHAEAGFVKKEEYDSLEKDLIKVAKITTYLLKNLPRRKLDAFKESEDFQSFKGVLKDRKLIRE